MAKGILYVETRPSSPEREAEYNTWYDEVHLPEVVALKGFVSARRFASGDDGSYVALYELEADDLDAAMQGLFQAVGSGDLHMSDAMGMDPAPSIRLLKLVTAYEPDRVSGSTS